MVILNKNDKETAIDTRRFTEIMKGRKTAVEVLGGDKQDISREIKVPARTATIFKIQ